MNIKTLRRMLPLIGKDAAAITVNSTQITFVSGEPPRPLWEELGPFHYALSVRRAETQLAHRKGVASTTHTR